jgi:hypothetical protein
MKSYLIAVAAIAALSLTACSSSPDSVVRDFYIHLGDGNPSKAAELIAPQSRAMWGGKVDAALLGMSQKIARCEGIDRLEVEQKQETDSMRIFSVKMTLKSKDPKCGVVTDTMKTIKADGKWQIFLG